MQRIIYKWGRLTEEAMCELWIARAKLSMRGNPALQVKNPNGTNVPVVVTWGQYCEKIGSSTYNTRNQNPAYRNITISSAIK